MDNVLIKSIDTNVIANLDLLEHIVKLILMNALAIHVKSLALVTILSMVITVLAKLVIQALIVD